MNILFDNVNIDSTSGPNTFAAQLWKSFLMLGHGCTGIVPYDPDVQLAFIESRFGRAYAPIVQRLDGVWFNSAQNWIKMNQPISATFRHASAVVIQSEFDRRLVRKYIGTHAREFVIHNGTDAWESDVEPLRDSIIDRFERVWCCASQWRPHKRLTADIDYFLECAPKEACLVVAGPDPDYVIQHDRVMYMGAVNRNTLLRLYKRAEVFVHLPWLAHCDNVLIDARACGCRIVCTDSGGTPEIAGPDALLVRDHAWDFKPTRLYEPPPLDFSDTRQNNELEYHPTCEIDDVAGMYIRAFGEVIDDE